MWIYAKKWSSLAWISGRAKRARISLDSDMQMCVEMLCFPYVQARAPRKCNATLGLHYDGSAGAPDPTPFVKVRICGLVLRTGDDGRGGLRWVRRNQDKYDYEVPIFHF